MRHGTGWVAAWLGVVLALAAPASAEETRYALLVGIDEYVDPAISPLTGSVADVVAMREALVTAARFPSSQVFLLTSDDPGNLPTTGSILARLKYIATEADSDDLVYVHFSLHAVVDDATGEGYLFTHRTDPHDYRRDGLPLKEVRELLDSMVAPKQILVLDGCRNDPERGKGDQPNLLDARFSRSPRITPRELPATAASFRLVLFACSVGQRAYEWPGRERGLFSVALEEALTGAAATDGIVTLGGFTSYVRSRVPDLVKLHLPGRQQSPDVPDPPAAAKNYPLSEAKLAPATAQLRATDLPAVAPRSTTTVPELEAVFARKAEKEPSIRITQAPTAPLSRAQAALITINFEADVDRAVKAYRWRLDDAAIVDGHARSWVDLQSVAPGTHLFQVQVQDHWGNWSAPARAEFSVLDNRRPAVSFTSPKADARVEGERLLVQLTGSDEDGQIQTYRLALDDSERFEQSPTGGFSLPAPVDGLHTLFAQSIDNEGALSLWQSLAIRFQYRKPEAAPKPAAKPEASAPAKATPPAADPLKWTKGQPPPEVKGLKLIGLNAQGYPEYDQELGIGVTMRFVLIPAGSFIMGSPVDEEGHHASEWPQHHVTLAAFLLAKTECTQKQWQTVMGSNPSKRTDHVGPVEQVSWTDVKEFKKRTGLTLPSEAQWEYACRAGATGAHHGPIDKVAWYDANSGNTTRPVGQKQANAFGLHDMLGNVWEWCEDTWHDNHSGAPTNGAPWVDTVSFGRVSRGGSWLNEAADCRSAGRNWYDPGNRESYLGLRLSKPLR